MMKVERFKGEDFTTIGRHLSINKVVDYANLELVRVVMEKVLEVIKILMVMAMFNTITPCKRWAYFKFLICFI